jgi:glutaredoxin
MPEAIAVQLVTTTGCSRCLAAKRAVVDMLASVQDEYRIDVRELDLLDHPELAAEYGFWRTPAVIVNGELAFSGMVDESAMREKLAAAIGAA